MLLWLLVRYRTGSVEADMLLHVLQMLLATHHVMPEPLTILVTALQRLLATSQMAP